MEAKDWGKAVLKNRGVRYCMLEARESCWESVAGKL